MNNSKASAFGLMLVFCLVANLGLRASGYADLPASHVPVPTYIDRGDLDNEEDIKVRISNMSGLIDMRYTKEVRDYIKRHLQYKKGTSMVLGRQTTFFPIFEEVLLTQGLPTDLKYLAIVESSLNPGAVSRAGAAGLWQIMRPTGRMLGLKINWEVDERKNAYRSTEAAVDYLKQLYDQFGSWELALAAYNSGPGNVRRAIRKGGSKDFWKIRRFLPRETRNYIPAFIAVNYLANFYYLHDLEPTIEQSDMLTVSNIMVHKRISFREIAEMTGTEVSVIKKLNPSYLRAYVPESKIGSHLLLPNYAARILLAELYQTDLPFVDKVLSHADNTLVDVDMKALSQERAQRLKFEESEPIPNAVIALTPMAPSTTLNAYTRPEEKEYWYKLSKRESLYDVSKKYKVPLKSLIEWNVSEENVLPGPGHLIRIRI